MNYIAVILMTVVVFIAGSTWGARCARIDYEEMAEHLLALLRSRIDQ